MKLAAEFSWVVLECTAPLAQRRAGQEYDIGVILMVCLPPPSLCPSTLLQSLTEFPLTLLPKTWQLGPQFEASWLLPASQPGAVGCMCTGRDLQIAGPTRRNPLLWRIRSVAELGRGNQALLAPLSAYSPCLKQSGQRPRVLLGQTSGGWQCPCMCSCVAV